VQVRAADVGGRDLDLARPAGFEPAAVDLEDPRSIL